MNQKDIVRGELAAKSLAEFATGVEVKMGSDECTFYKASHENCLDCYSFPACSKLVALLLASLTLHPERTAAEVMASKDPRQVDFDFPEEEY